MLDTIDAVRAALRANDQQPYGRPRTVTAEELVDAAEQFDDPELLAMALLELMEAYEYDAEQRKLPVVFARVAKLRKDHPDAFTDWAAHAADWRYKWVAHALLSVPDVPLEAIRRWHGELRDHYRAQGHDLQPYYACRHHLAAHTGTGREDAFELWATRARSRYSDCRACELRAQALHFLSLGEDARALETWQPVFSGEASCSEEPHVSRAHALLPLLRAGRTDEARSHHLTGYRWARGRSAAAEAIGLHLEFCALTGNEPRGLEILAENRDLFDRHGDPLSRLHFLTAAQLLLARLLDAGHGDLPVSGPPGANWTAAALHAELRAEGEALAARFDARNGTTAVGDARRARLAQTPPTAEPLPLGLRAAGPAAPTAPAAEAAPAVPADLVELVRLARESSLTHHPESTVHWNRVEALIDAPGHQHPDDPELGPLDRIRAEIALERAYADHADDRDGVALLTTAAELFDRAGLPARALGCRARAAGAIGELPGDLDAVDELIARLQELDAAGEPLAGRELVAALQAAANTRLRALFADGFGREGGPEPEEVAAAEAAVERLHAEAARRDLTHRRINARLMAARTHLMLDRHDRAEELLAEAEQLVEQAAAPWRLVHIHGQRGEIALYTGDPATAEDLLSRAAATAARYGDRTGPVARIHDALGRARLAQDRPDAAVRAFTEAADRYDRAGAAEAAASTRIMLGQTLRAAGRTDDGVAVLESALLEPAFTALDVREQAQARLTLARGLRDLDEHRAAAEEYLRLADQVAGFEDRQVHTMVACEAAVALAHAGQWPAADRARQRALDSHRTAPRADSALDMLLRLARLTADHLGPDGAEQALARLDEADEVIRTAAAEGHDLDTDCPAATLHDTRARTLVDLGRPEEALAAIEQAIAAFTAFGPAANLGRAESVRYAALIEARALDRPQDARTRLDAAVAWCRSVGEPDAAAHFAKLREQLG